MNPECDTTYAGYPIPVSRDKSCLPRGFAYGAEYTPPDLVDDVVVDRCEILTTAFGFTILEADPGAIRDGLMRLASLANHATPYATYASQLYDPKNSSHLRLDFAQALEKAFSTDDDESNESPAKQFFNFLSGSEVGSQMEEKDFKEGFGPNLYLFPSSPEKRARKEKFSSAKPNPSYLIPRKVF